MVFGPTRGASRWRRECPSLDGLIHRRGVLDWGSGVLVAWLELVYVDCPRFVAGCPLDEESDRPELLLDFKRSW